MLLDDLLTHLKESGHTIDTYNMAGPLAPIESLSLDSRTLQKGSLFIALKGTHANGEEFISDAIQKGAAAVLISQKGIGQHTSHHQETPFIALDNIRLATSQLSKLFYPSQPETTIAVTGTNGKTSTADFTRQIWETLGHKGASLGTLGVRSKSYMLEKHLTTPEAPYLHQVLQNLQMNQIDHLAMEASSHGIDQHRLDSVDIKAAGFTNISPEHLDYHETMEAYLQAKLGLFQRILPSNGTCVLNADIPAFQKIKSACAPHPVLSYGRHAEDIQIQSIAPSDTGQHMILSVLGQPFEIAFPLIGEFQAYNALCALGLVLACDKGCLPDAVKALETLQSIPGRLEHIASTPSGAHIYIDYAHTPDGMQNLLMALRNHTKNKLHLVFGGGGNRDESTRLSRGALAHKLADTTYICDDNPRDEDPKKIRDQILEGCPSAWEIPDRTKAILDAIHSLEEGDILVVAGKGREQGQIIQGTTHPFDDAQTILDTLQELP